MRVSLRRLGYECGATLLALCGYIGAIALLGMVAIQFLDIAEVSADHEFAHPGWIMAERHDRPFVIGGAWQEAPNRPELRPSVAGK